ncbi:hypothetical protein KBD59_02255 [Candidatus Gracilibacteria bacterium]|nr:hypothetical protein [Candidatus Gracilibacteria bacterium]
MEDTLTYENRERLYKYLIDDFGFSKVDEGYDSEHFGNYSITLSGEDFLLCYVNDRSFLTINIASKLEPNEFLAVSFIRDFIHNPDRINSDEQDMDNYKRIERLNNFIKRDFEKISELYKPNNYYNTKKQINDLLKLQFEKRFPGMTQ